jgi:hypothetical protein
MQGRTTIVTVERIGCYYIEEISTFCPRLCDESEQSHQEEVYRSLAAAGSRYGGGSFSEVFDCTNQIQALHRPQPIIDKKRRRARNAVNQAEIAIL